MSGHLLHSLQRQTILALNELGQAVTSSLRLEDVLLRILMEVSDLVGAEGVTILLPKGEELVFAAVCGPGTLTLKGLAVPRDAGVAGYVMRTGEPVWQNPEQSSVPGLAWNHHIEVITGYRVGSLISAPLRTGGATIGVLTAISRTVDGLPPESLPVLMAAANWAAIAIANAQLHEQAQQAREAQTILEERYRMSRELHDAVTQSLYSMATLAGAWRRQIDAGQLAPQKEHIAELGELAQQALREVRLLIYELRPSELQEEGLLGAVYRRLEAVEQRSGVQTRLSVTDAEGRLFPASSIKSEAVGDFYRMPPAVEHGLYRIVQEALNNALKHSGATAITVAIRLGNSTLSVAVEDDGRGFDVGKHSSGNGGLGLTNMEERARQLGGKLVVRSSPQGTTVQVLGVPFRLIDAEEMIG